MTWGQTGAVGTRVKGVGDLSDAGGHRDGGGDDSEEGLMGGGDGVQRDHRDDRVVMGMAAVEGPRGRCLTFFLWKLCTITCFSRGLASHTLRCVDFGL